MEKTIRIQPKERADMTLPYPFFINEKGMVERQDFWKGNPFMLIGFNGTKKQEMDKKTIDIAVFKKNPKKAVGLYPIFANKKGEWTTYGDKIESVSVKT